MDNPYEQDPSGGQPEYSSYGEPESNPLGIVGFILSLTCLLAPLGLLVSIIALFKRPRGFAIAGTVIGLLLSAVVGFVGVGAYMFANQWRGGIAIRMAGMQEEILETQIQAYQRETGSLPSSLDEVNLPSGVLTDPWGNPYEYSVDESGTWVISSPGPDGEEGTNDDIDDLSALVSGLEGQSDTAEEWIETAQQNKESWPGFMEIIELGQNIGEWRGLNENASAVAGQNGSAPEDSPETPSDPSPESPDNP